MRDHQVSKAISFLVVAVIIISGSTCTVGWTLKLSRAGAAADTRIDD